MNKYRLVARGHYDHERSSGVPEQRIVDVPIWHGEVPPAGEELELTGDEDITALVKRKAGLFTTEKLLKIDLINFESIVPQQRKKILKLGKTAIGLGWKDIPPYEQLSLESLTRSY